MARFTLEDAKRAAQDIDVDRVAATTEDDIRRHMVEDGFDPNAELGPAQVVLPPAEVRAIYGMTQAAFAAWLGVPLATLRNWEQGRTLPDPGARTMLNILAREPEAVRRALGDPRDVAA